MNRWTRRETAEQFERTTRELNEERASALLRISRMLESFIDQMHETRARIEALDNGEHADRAEHAEHAERAREVAAYAELRRKALQYRWFLEVQREALGLRQHHRLDEFYKIPDSLV